MMHLFKAWDQIAPLFQKQMVMLFLDYDGTMVPIARNPESARLSRAAKALLGRLSKTDGVRVALVSGRSLGDMKEKVGLPSVTYVGNHGLEFQGPKVRYVHPTARASQKMIGQIGKQLALAFKAFPGIRVENKVLTLSVHYRHLAVQKVMAARKIFFEVLNPYLRYAQVHFTRGKKVWEVRPPTQWNKGRIVLWLLAGFMAQTSEKVIPVYAGDDRTDEDAFQAIGRKGIGIKVTRNESAPSRASYYLRSPREVLNFLKRLMRLKEKEKSYAGL